MRPFLRGSQQRIPLTGRRQHIREFGGRTHFDIRLELHLRPLVGIGQPRVDLLKDRA